LACRADPIHRTCSIASNASPLEEVTPPPTLDVVFPEPATVKEAIAVQPALFASLDDDALLSIGVSADWLADVRAASEDGFFRADLPPAPP